MAPSGLVFGVLYLAVASALSYSSSYRQTAALRRDDWGYQPHNGPNTWASKYPTCGKAMQSPVALPSVWANHTFIRRFNWVNFEVNRTLQLQNNGKFLTLKIKPDRLAIPYHKGSIFEPSTRFEFEEVQFHWGENNAEGSEHSQAGTTYPGEMHVISWDRKYGSLENAKNYPGGVAIAVFFLQVQQEDNAKFDFLLHEIFAVNGTNRVRELPDSNFLFLYPINQAIHDCEFFLYEGSFTSPPCSEGVMWHIYTDATNISVRQMEHLRSLVNYYGQKLAGNNRPVQPLNNRKVWQHRENPKPASAIPAHSPLTVAGFEYVQPYLGRLPVDNEPTGYGR